MPSPFPFTSVTSLRTATLPADCLSEPGASRELARTVARVGSDGESLKGLVIEQIASL